MGFDYELYEAPDRKFGSMSEVSSIEGLSSWMSNPKLFLKGMMIRDHFCDGLDSDSRYPACIC